MTYQEVNDRLTKVQTALQSLQDGSYANSPSIDVPQMTAQLQEQEAKLQEQLMILSEQEKGMITTDDEAKAEKLANKGVDVNLTTEEEGIKYSIEETKVIAREVGKAVAKGLNSVGDELASMKVKNIEESSFDIHVQYKKDTSTDDFSFYISENELYLTDFSFNKVVGSVGVKPSGEPIVHVDVIANELVKHWSSQMKEGMSDEEWSDAEQNQRLEDHPEKDMIKKIQALIAKEKGLKEKINEAPEGMSYIEVSVRDARKAMEIMDDLHKGHFEMNGSNVYYFKDDSMAYDAMMDLGAQGIEIIDTNIEEGVKEGEETPEGGMDQGGDFDVAHQDDEPNMLKKDIYDIATYAAKLYKQLDKYDKHDGEVDFPHWWQKKVTLAREYISSAQHFLEAEEKQPALDQLALEENVDKVTGGIPYRRHGNKVIISEPLDDDTKERLIRKAKEHDYFAQPNMAGGITITLKKGMYEELDEMVDPSYADMLAQFIILMGSGYGALQAVKKLGDETGDISLDSVKKAIKKHKDGDVSEIGMFNDPVGYEKSKPEKPTYTKKYVSKDVYDIFKNGKKVKTVKGGEGDANAWINNANKGQKNEEAVGQSISDLKPGDKFEYNGKTYTLVKHKEGNIATVILPNGDTSTVSFGGKVNTGKKAGIGPDAFGQGKGHHIDEASLDKIQKAHSLVVAKMKELAQHYKTGDTSVVPQLKDLTAKKKELERQLDDKVAGTGRDQELSIQEAEATCCGKCGRKHVKGTKCKTPYLKGKDHCRTR